MERRAMTAHLPQSLADKIDELAFRLDRSRESIVQQALADWVDREERHHVLSIEAFADVDEGNVLDHEAVIGWAESLDGDETLSYRR